jgi:hypothetical protein
MPYLLALLGLAGLAIVEGVRFRRQFDRDSMDEAGSVQMGTDSGLNYC